MEIAAPAGKNFVHAGTTGNIPALEGVELYFELGLGT
jgi:hypothetical protein